MIDGKIFRRYIIFYAKKCKGKIMELKLLLPVLSFLPEVASNKKPAILQKTGF